MEYVRKTSGILASIHKILAAETSQSNPLDTEVSASALLKYQLIQPLKHKCI